MNEESRMTLQPRLFWDWGTAYDLFVSLMVLHQPGKFGLRAAWAAGMRSRLPADQRETLEQFQALPAGMLPYHWLYNLPDPKDGASVLQALGAEPAEDRLHRLVAMPGIPEQVSSALEHLRQAGAWSDDELERLRSFMREHGKESAAATKGLDILQAWYADPIRAGERLLSALTTYQEVFFAEEEGRIRPALLQALEAAKQLAQRSSVPDLVEQLSQGVRLDEGFEAPELLLVPSYWGTPLLIFGHVRPEREIMLFGVRPKDASLVPGEQVPDAQLQALKALSDPTRLRILRYLAEEPLTPTQLSGKLRLRPSTVVHHLHILRLATLVQLSLGGGGVEKRYSARTETVSQIFLGLEQFLQGEREPARPLAEAEEAAEAEAR